MMKSYWAVMLDVTEDNDVITYGYTFREKNIRNAKLHAVDVCRRFGIMPLPTVWRISHAKHVELAKYTTPTMMSFRRNDEDAA